MANDGESEDMSNPINKLRRGIMKIRYIQEKTIIKITLTNICLYYIINS
jgi:hypothetical protein